jgi:hypothetical protein
MATKLRYPKSLFSRKEVARERSKMDFPKAWTIKPTRTSYVMTLSKSSVKKHYARRR